MWQTPKTDWKASDYFNIADYNRIKGNLNEIRTQASTLWADVPFDAMGADKTYADDGFYADEINLFESNLEHFRNALVSIPIGNEKEYSANGPFIDYQELNRIESACLQFYENVMSAKNDRPRLTFILGGGRFGRT